MTIRLFLNVSPIPSACCSSRLANKVSMIFILLPVLTRAVKMSKAAQLWQVLPFLSASAPQQLEHRNMIIKTACRMFPSLHQATNH